MPFSSISLVHSWKSEKHIKASNLELIYNIYIFFIYLHFDNIGERDRNYNI